MKAIKRLTQALPIAMASTMAMGAVAKTAVAQPFIPPSRFAVTPAEQRSGHSQLPVFGLALQPSPRPHASTGRKVSMVIGGAIAASVSGLVGFKIFDDPQGPNRKVKGDEGYTPQAIRAYVIGSFLGATATTYLIGRGDGSHGSLKMTVLGSGVATAPLLLMLNDPYAPLFGIVFISPVQGLLGTVGYQSSRTP